MYIEEVIRDIVAMVNAEWTGDTLTYIPGSKKEIEQTLVEWSKDPTTKNSKYPCLMLFTPINVLEGEQGKRYESVMSVNMALVTDTQKNYKLFGRLDDVYEPILTPLFELFKTQLLLSNYFHFENSRVLCPHSNIYHYSPTPAKDQNVFAAVLDAIEINGLELKMYEQC